MWMAAARRVCALTARGDVRRAGVQRRHSDGDGNGNNKDGFTFVSIFPLPHQ